MTTIQQRLLLAAAVLLGFIAVTYDLLVVALPAAACLAVWAFLTLRPRPA
jgi:hypothetical protein